MAKVRVYELARELGTTSKKLIEAMKEMDIEVKNHMSTLDREAAGRVIAVLTGRAESEAGAKEKPAAPVEKKKAAPAREEKKSQVKRPEKAAAPRARRKTDTKPPIKKKRRRVSVEGRVTVGEVAALFETTAADLITKLLELGVVANINQAIDPEAIELVADEYNADVEFIADPIEQELLGSEDEGEKKLSERHPVVTVLGHVDHGKTSLLDAIRESDVTAGEAGGITQHIGAYTVEASGKKIVFLDTPGHEAFTAMRARGAQVTDIAVLVVAADDGVKPQTIEAINHARAAEVPIIVAINKIDKANVNPERVKQQLSEQGLIPEEWGGETICVPVSAKQRQGLDELLEMILLVSELSELQADPGRTARGTVIEAHLDRGRGPVATVLVQDGTLRVGHSLICGTSTGKVRAMLNQKGERVTSAGPATPVELLGLNEVPLAGDRFQVIEDERLARQVAERRSQKIKAAAQRSQRVTLDDLFKQIQEGETKELNLVLKGDVHGSVEALQEAILKLSLEEVKVRVIHAGVGAINESDVMLASASNAIVIGFNVRPDSNARRLAEADRVDLRLYRVIYEALEDIRLAVQGLLKPVYREEIEGQVEIRQVFKASRFGNIAGCYVTEGKITRNSLIRLIRDGVVVHEGKLASLKRFQDDVREVASGFECGILIEGFSDIAEGDQIEAYTMKRIN
ncbi:MAG TPA: translation initiation factor IF-2 [Firmicutes bacterium]|nr:translation initiation factor IF-2 [Bacillota bacterium]